MYSLFYDLEKAVKSNVECDDFSGALDGIKQFIITVMNMESTPGDVVGARKVDQLCELIGNRFFDCFFQPKLSKESNRTSDRRVVIVCTGLYKYGGTSLVISDLVKAHPGCECTVIATNFLDDMTAEDLELSRIGGAGATVSVCPTGSSEAKMRWLMQQFLDIAPSRIFLLNHHQDSVIISAAAPFVDKASVVFYHHADYNICLGVHLKGAIHVDPHNVGFYNCRTKEDIRDNAYIPMTVDDRVQSRVGSEFIRNGELTTCSSGHYLKFRNFYLYPYAELLVDRLRIRNGKHIHIGGLLAADLLQMRRKLSDNGIDPDRLVHIPWTASLWKSLIDNDVDMFIGSFPIGGARTTIEAMGAGLPMLMPESYLSRFFSSRDIVYPDVYLWRYPADFSKVLANVNAKSLSMHSKRSRAHYVLNYSSQSIDLEGTINAICDRRPTPAPYRLYPHHPDHLDRALHFGHLDNLTSGYAVRNALAGLERLSGADAAVGAKERPEIHPIEVLPAPADEIPVPRRRHAAALRGVVSKWVKWQGRDPSFKGKKVQGALTPRALAKAVAQLPRRERELYQAIRKRPDGIGFDPAAYLDNNPDVAAEGVDATLHFVKYGHHEGRAPATPSWSNWHIEMNDGDPARRFDVLLDLAQTRSEYQRKKAAVFAYAWNPAGLPDAYIRAMVTALAALGINVDVYIAGQFSRNAGTKGYRPDLSKSDLKGFLRSQSYDFALSFNNAMVLPESVDALGCKIVSILVDSIHHMFDHMDEGLWQAFALQIHAAPIYTAFIREMEQAPNVRATGSFLPAATKTESRGSDPGQETIPISWIASMLGDYHFDGFLSRVDDEVPDGLALMATCLSDIEKTGQISSEPTSQDAARILCEWSHWDYPLLEMHFQEVITNRMRLAVVEKLAPLGLKLFGNTRWRTALATSPGLVRSFRSGAHLRRHADLCDIYDRSKISINIPQVHAGTGMQYRILDILASKSLLITQHVPAADMEHLFGADSPIVTFTDIDDLHSKCAYYLKHEKERLARVKACNALVATGFSFRERVLEYLALSNPPVARKVAGTTGRGSVTLISPERVTEWGARHRRDEA